MHTLSEVLKYEKTRYKHPDQRFVNFQEIKFILKTIKDILPENSLLLDVPCGYGRFTVPLNTLGFKVIAGDISFAMVERTRQKTGVTGISLDILKLPFRSNIFDATFSMRLFQHIDFEFFQPSLKELSRISKKYVIFSFYRKNPVHTMERRIFGIRSGIRFYDIDLVRMAVRNAGLQIILLKSILGPLHAQTIAVCKKG